MAEKTVAQTRESPIKPGLANSARPEAFTQAMANQDILTILEQRLGRQHARRASGSRRTMRRWSSGKA